MEKTNVRVRKWGNSFGVILPKSIIDDKNIKEGTEIEIIVETKKTMTVGDVLRLAKEHKLPKLKKSTKELLDEVDKEFEPEE